MENHITSEEPNFSLLQICADIDLTTMGVDKVLAVKQLLPNVEFYFKNEVGGSSSIIEKIVNISPTEWKDQVAHPVELVAKPGTNKYIQLLDGIIYVKFLTTSYDTPDISYIYYEDSPDYSAFYICTTNAGTNITEDLIQTLSLTAIQWNPTSGGAVINKGLYLTTSQDCIAGDGPIKIIFRYRIIDLTL